LPDEARPERRPARLVRRPPLARSKPLAMPGDRPHAGGRGLWYVVPGSHWGFWMHIGLIGGIGPAAPGFYYRGLIDRHASSQGALELTMVHADVREMAKNLSNRDARSQADIFARLLRRLAAAGADVAVVTSMGGHFCMRELEPISPLPLLNALPAVDAA